MNWIIAEQRLIKMAEVYNRDALHRIIFDNDILPLMLRFDNGERSWDLYDSIENTEKLLMKDTYVQREYQESCKGFFMNPMIKPSYDDLLHIIGNQENNWSRIFNFLRNELRLKVYFKFHDIIGWVLEFRKSGNIEIILIPDKNNFKVNIPSVGGICLDIHKINNISDLHNLINNHIQHMS